MEAGWYSDPNGGSDLRWWDGSAWTDHTSAATAEVGAEATAPPTDAVAADAPAADTAGGMPAPSEPGAGAVPPPAPDSFGGFAPPGAASGDFAPAAPASGDFAPPGPGSGGFPPAGPPPQNDSSRYLLIGLVALIVVLLGVGGVILVSGGGDDDDTTTASTTTTEATEESTTSTTEADEETTTTTAGEPDSEFISSGGLTLTRLPDPWQDWVANNRGSIPELQGTAGQFVIVQDLEVGQWMGNILIGDLVNSIPYDGEADLPTATHALADALVASYYVEDAATTIVNETAVTIDGRPGYFIHHELTFAQEGLEATREKVIVVVVDTGRSRPGVFWASIPYNRVDLNEGMDQAYASLQVND